MTIKLSLIRAFPNRHWGELNFPSRAPVDWRLDLAYLQYLWELDEDTVLETTFFQRFDETIRFPNLPRYMLDLQGCNEN